MTVINQRRKIHFIILATIFFMVVVMLGDARATADDEVVVLEIAGPVTPAMVNYFERGIAAAEADGAAAVVIVLDTPGGQLDSTQKIAQLFHNAEVPVIVYVAPSGAQAASAGAIITIAAHASGMAPRTVIGAASPVDSGGEDINETMYRKVVEDMKAQVRGTAGRRGEEAVDLAEAMIEDARAVSAEEALDAGLIDAVATDLPALLNQLNGQEVALVNSTVTLQTADAAQTDLGMSFIEQLLLLLTNPFLIGVLLTIGVQAILIELSSPGGWVAGLIGILCLGLALYGIGQLPANWLGLGLIFLAFILFVFEVKTPTVGGLALAGTITLLAGILVLFNSPGSPDFARISLVGALTLTAFTGGIFLFVVTKVTSAQRKKPQTGKEGMIGQTGRVRKTFVPRPDGSLTFIGSVLVMGELWRAEADAAIESGEKVRVAALDGFTLKVESINTQE